jgi:hypothetical protein
MGYGCGAGLLYHAQCLECYSGQAGQHQTMFRRLATKSNIKTDFHRRRPSPLERVISWLLLGCVRALECGGGESLIYRGIGWSRETGWLWQVVRWCGGEYRMEHVGMVRAGITSGMAWAAVARWMGGGEVDDGRLPSWEEME